MKGKSLNNTIIYMHVKSCSWPDGLQIKLRNWFEKGMEVLYRL